MEVDLSLMPSIHNTAVTFCNMEEVLAFIESIEKQMPDVDTHDWGVKNVNYRIGDTVMRVQFVSNNYDIIAEFNVNKAPTKEEAEKIQTEIEYQMDSYEQDNGDFEGFDFYSACYCAVDKYLTILSNPVVHTFFI